jgi:hypothetical protein
MRRVGPVDQKTKAPPFQKSKDGAPAAHNHRDATVDLPGEKWEIRMSFYEKYRNPPSVSDLPIWKWLLFFSALGFSLAITAIAVDKDLTIYGTAPDHPVQETGQTYPVYVEHGAPRYVASSEKESADLWIGRAGTWAGAAFLGAFLLWVTSPNEAKHRSR